MRSRIAIALFALLAATPLLAASKPHFVALGRRQTVKRLADPTKPDTPSINLKIRPLYVDTKLQENTAGPPHEVTDHVFVVCRAYRVHDSLPVEDAKPRRQWQLEGWLQVDRVSGHVSALNLPEFDPEESRSRRWPGIATTRPTAGSPTMGRPIRPGSPGRRPEALS